MAFDVQGARQAGYSDAEIADHLAEAAKFDAAAARKAGYSDQELISHLADTGPLTFRDKPVDDPSLPSVSEFGDVGPGASFNQPVAPTATKPPPVDTGTFSPEGVYVPPGTVPAQGPPESKQALTSILGLPKELTPEQRKQVSATTPLERVIGAAYEGGVNTPDASGWVPGGLQLGRFFVNPLLEAGGAILRGGLQFLGEAAGGDPQLTRDIQALPEAFPTGDVGLPGGPRSYPEARAGGTRGTLQAPWRGNTPPPVTLNELSGAIDRVPPEPPRVNQLAPLPSEPQPAPAPDQAQPQPQPTARGEPTHIYQGPEHDVPVTATGNEQTHTDGRTYAEVQPPDGPVTWVPKEHLVARTATEAAAPDSAWVGTTVDDLGNLVRENAAQGGPASLGAAATPEQLAAMSPSQAKAYRRMAEVNRVVSPIEGEDASIKVPGSIPTEAEAKGDPVVSQQEKLVRDRKPEAYGGPDGRLTKNTNARVQLYDDSTLSDPQIDTLNEQQKAQAKADTAKILAVAKPVDGAPVEAQIRGVLNHPRTSELEDVVKTMQPILKKLYDSDGNLKTDPQAWWGIHDNLMARLAKAKDPLNASGAEKYSFDQLLDAKNAVDGVLNRATDGAFQTFLDNQSKFFQQKNAAILLRDFRAKMINPNNGNIYANKFHRFVTDLAIRRGKPGIDPAMDIPDDLFGKLMDINDDLKRAGRINLGSPRGSPTNLYFELANGLGIVGAHSIMQAAGGGPVGAAVMQGGINALKNRLANMRLNSLVERSLNYPPPTLPPNPNPPGQFIQPTLRNPMMPPP